MWQYLYHGASWRRGPVTMIAIAAVDTALWDIKGKVAGLPVSQLPGGRSRDGVLVTATRAGPTPRRSSTTSRASRAWATSPTSPGWRAQQPCPLLLTVGDVA
jgi:L-alanine-DL-glutamate epimerase-like enolase superfamily enzyme